MSQSLPRRYFKKIISNFISLVSGFVVTSLGPRALGPLEFGKFSFITDIFSQIFVFLEAGSSDALYNKICQDHQNLLLLRRYSKLLLLVNLFIIGGLVVSFTFDLSKDLFSDLPFKFILMGFIYSSIFWLNSIYVKILDGLGQTSQMEQQRIYVSILRACGIISLFFIHQITLTNFFIFQILVVAILNLSFLRLIYGYSKAYTLESSKNFWRYLYQYSSPLFVYGMIGAFATIADRWLLQKYSGLSQQGYFSLATQFGAICFLFSSSLTPLFHREIAITKHKKDLEGTHNLIYKSFPVLFFIAAMLGIFCSVNAPFIVHLLAGDKFSGQTFAYSLMFLYPIHQTYGQLTGSLYYALEETKLYRNIGTVLLVVGIGVSFFLLAPPEFFGLHLGFVGLAIKNVGLQLLNVHILLFFSFRKIKIKMSPFVFNQIAILASLGSIAYLAKTLTDIALPTNTVVNLLFNGVLYLCLTTLVLYVCYRKNLPILMKYTQENIAFVLAKAKNFQNQLK